MPASHPVYRRVTSRCILLACLLALLIPTHLAASPSATPVVDDITPEIFETPTPEATVIPEDVGTPDTVATPDPEPEVNTDMFTLITPADLGDGPATLDENGTLELMYEYAVTTDRTSTTIIAKILDQNGTLAEGWSVSLNHTDEPTWTETEVAAADEVFAITVSITGSATSPQQTVELVLRSIVRVDNGGVNQAGPVSILVILGPEPAAGVAAPGSPLTAHSATPVAESLSPMAVSPPDGPLSCANANTRYPISDAIGPGETIMFACQYRIGVLGVVPAFTATATLSQPAFDDGWRISVASPSLKLLGAIDVIGGQTGWNERAVSATTADLASVASILQFDVYLRAPLTTPQSSSTAAVSIETTCTGVLTLGQCGSLGFPVKKSATLTGTMHLTHANTGGGALLDAALLPQITSGLGTPLFDFKCTDVNTARVIRQGETARATCTLKVVAGLNLLSLISVGGTIRLDSSPGPFRYTIDSSYTCPGDLLAICLGRIADVSVLETGLPITINIMPECGPVNPEILYSVRLKAEYDLRLLLGAVRVRLTDGWATIPFTITEGQSVGLGASGSGLVFDSTRWNGIEYPDTAGALAVSVEPTGAGCVVPNTIVRVTGDLPLSHSPTKAAIDDAHISLQGTSDPGVSWGHPIATSGTLANDLDIFKTESVSVPTDGAPAVVDLTFLLDPPSDAPPGTYNGTIVITTNPPGPED